MQASSGFSRVRPCFRVTIGIFLILVSLAACGMGTTVFSDQAPGTAAFPVNPGRLSTIYVLSNGFHSGIAIAVADLTSDRIPERADLPRTRYLEIGWGDADYYQARDPGVLVTLNAALLPTSAVLHVIARNRDPMTWATRSLERIPLTLDRARLDRLIRYIDQSFDRNGQVSARNTGSARNAWSHFYPATGRFHLFNTCNSWVVQGLAAAGFNVDTALVITSEGLMAQVRHLRALQSAEAAAHGSLSEDRDRP